MGDEVRIWTTVGSAGTLNQADLAKVSLHQSIVQLGADDPVFTGGGSAPRAGPALSTIQAVVRYNVTPVDGLFTAEPPFRYGLQIRFRNHITAKLMEVDLETGAEQPLILFDSQKFPANPNFHVETAWPKDHSAVLDFVGKAYYVEATLTAFRAPVGHPAEISMIKIFASADVPGLM